MRGAWYIIESCSDDELDDVIESLPALVKGTEQRMPSDASKTELESLNELLVKTLDLLGRQQIPDESVISAVAGLKDTICERLPVVASVPDGVELAELGEQSAEDVPDLRFRESI
jgi:hypothetical protein